MNRDYLKQIMIDQKETYLNNPMIKRDYPLEDNVNYCFVGIRRTGKSYICLLYTSFICVLQKLCHHGNTGFIAGDFGKLAVVEQITHDKRFGNE